MKKIILSLAILVVSVSAMAQSSFTLQYINDHYAQSIMNGLNHSLDSLHQPLVTELSVIGEKMVYLDSLHQVDVLAVEIVINNVVSYIYMGFTVDHGYTDGWVWYGNGVAVYCDCAAQGSICALSWAGGSFRCGSSSMCSTCTLMGMYVWNQ